MKRFKITRASARRLTMKPITAGQMLGRSVHAAHILPRLAIDVTIDGQRCVPALLVRRRMARLRGAALRQARRLGVRAVRLPVLVKEMGR